MSTSSRSSVLLDAYAHEERLTPLGNKVKRAELRGALVARALSEASFAQQPDDGAGRASDLRHRAAADRHHGAAPVALRRPGPPGPRTVAGRVPATAPAARPVGGQPGLPAHRGELRASSTTQNPEFAGVHYMTADTVEECWQLLRQSLMSISYESLAHVPSYSAWLAEAGLDARLRAAPAQPCAHRRERAGQALDPEEPVAPVRARRAAQRLSGRDRRADPSRATHADRVRCSLSAQATAGQSELFVGDVIGRYAARPVGARRGRVRAGARTARPGALPRRRVRRVRRRTRSRRARRVRALRPAARGRGACRDRGGRRSEPQRPGARPAHRYTLEEFGLTEAMVDEHFDRSGTMEG